MNREGQLNFLGYHWLSLLWALSEGPYAANEKKFQSLYTFTNRGRHFHTNKCVSSANLDQVSSKQRRLVRMISHMAEEI